MNQDGLTITSDASDVKKDLFKLRKKNSDGSYTNYMYVNDNGDIVINGSYMQITSTDMFNKLTNNGEAQGIYMKNGKIYLNCEYIDAHTLAAEKIKGSITNGSWGIDFTNGTMSIGTLAVGSITGTLGNTSAGNWGINFNNGTMSIGNLSADKITTGTLSADRIGANSIAVGKLTGSITNSGWGINFDNGTMSIGKLAVGSITGTLGNTSAGNWGIDFTNGTMSIGNLSAAKITTGTLSADRIDAHSLAVEKLTGSITNSGWGINFNNGTMSIGTLSANKIVAGILTDKTGKNSWNLDTGTFITKQGKIGDFTITSNGLSGVYETSTNKSSISFTGDGLMVKQISSTDPTSGLTIVTNKEVQISNGEISFRSSSVGMGDIYCDDAGNELQVHNGAGSTIIAIPRTGTAYFYGTANKAEYDTGGNYIATAYIKSSHLGFTERTPTSSTNGNIDLAIRSSENTSGSKYAVISVWCTQKYNPPANANETGTWANANYICTPFRNGAWWYARVTTTAGDIVSSTQVRVKVAYISLDAFTTGGAI